MPPTSYNVGPYFIPKTVKIAKNTINNFSGLIEHIFFFFTIQNNNKFISRNRKFNLNKEITTNTEEKETVSTIEKKIFC